MVAEGCHTCDNALSSTAEAAPAASFEALADLLNKAWLEAQNPLPQKTTAVAVVAAAVVAAAAAAAMVEVEEA